MLNEAEKRVFVKLLSNGNYILDFPSDIFDCRVYKYVGFCPCKEFRLLPASALENLVFSSSLSEETVQELLLSLFLHYKEDSVYWWGLIGWDSPDYDQDQFNRYHLCKEIAQRVLNEEGNGIPFELLNSVSLDMDAEHYQTQIKKARDSVEKDPEGTIGQAKDLVESTCRTILRRLGVQVEQKIALSKLVGKTMGALEVDPDSIDPNLKKYKEIMGVGSAIAKLTENVAILRNEYGDGHGRDDTYKGLQPRHAKLVLGAASTIVYFLWEAFKLKHPDKAGGNHLGDEPKDKDTNLLTNLDKQGE